MFWLVPQRCSAEKIYSSGAPRHTKFQCELWLSSWYFVTDFNIVSINHMSFLLISQHPRFEDHIKIDKNRLKFLSSLIQKHIPAVAFFHFTTVSSSEQNRTFPYWQIAKIWSQKTFTHRTSSFCWNWKVAVLVAFIWPLDLLPWHTFGWVDFASNILVCSINMYSVNNSYCVNLVWIEQRLGLVVIHPAFSHLNLWFCLKVDIRQFNESVISINRTCI